MYNKTTSLYFLKYGRICTERNFENNHLLTKRTVTLHSKEFNSLFINDDETFITVHDGIAMLYVSNSENIEEFDKYVIHRNIAIKQGIYFNIIPLTEDVKLSYFTAKSSKFNSISLKKSFSYEKICSSVIINEIFAYYYSVKSVGYSFVGESHNHYELTYIDNGSFDVCVNNKEYTLEPYDIIIFGPNQFHKHKIPHQAACSYLTVMFSMNIEDASPLLNKVFKAQKDIIAILNNFIKETSSQHPYQKELVISTFQLLIAHLLQSTLKCKPARVSTPIQQHFENELLNEIMTYITKQIYEPITIEEICFKFSISRSTLQNLFKENLSVSPKSFINELKLSKSKLLIKESKYTISEIALMLGFNSIHYFSRKFTQRYSITPTEYAKSIYNA